MKLSKAQKKFIKNNYKSLTPKEIAEKLGVSENLILSHLKETGRSKKEVLKEDNLTGWEKLTSVSQIKDFLFKNRVVILGLIVISVVVYFNSLTGQLVSDDYPAFRDNTRIRNMSSSFRTLHLQNIIYSISLKVFGVNPIPLHVFSLILHITAVLLVFIFVSMLFGRKVGSITGFLFAVHPINSEAVSWISALNYITNTIGILSFGISYVLYCKSGKVVYQIVSCFLLLLALIFFRGPFLIAAAPLLFVIDQFLIHESVGVKPFFRIVPQFLLTILLFLYHFFNGALSARISGLQLSSATDGSGTSYFLRLVYTLYTSFKLLVFPVNLTLYHEGEILTPTLIVLMSSFAVILLFFILFLYKRNRVLSGLLLFIIFSLLPVFSPVQIAWFAAERYLYTGSIAFCALLALLFLTLQRRFKKPGLATLLSVFLVMVYSVRTVIRNNDWATPSNLWFATAKVSPRSAKVHNNLGDIYSTRGDFQNAIKEFTLAIDLSDGAYPEATHNLGLAYLNIGEDKLAEEKFLQAVALSPSLWQSYLNLADIEYKRGNKDKVRYYLNKVLEIDPDNKQVRRLLNEM